MAVITKNDILAISESFEALYGDISSQILIIMAEYLGKDIDEPIEVWQQKRLQEVNILMKKVQAILASGNYASTTNEALNMVIDETLKDIEPKLIEASKAGALKKTTSYTDSLSINELKKNMKEDFALTFNNMNQTIQSMISQSYTKAISNVMAYFNLRRQTILDEAVQKTYDGETLNKAVINAIKQMANEGVPAFIDRAGRKWSAEAYASMYTRTNVHNMSIDVVMKRNEDYDNDLFEVSKHAGARPKCAPWQGKIVSKKNRRGYVKDGNGKKVKYIALSDTSYGEPDGLLGINCGHQLYPFIPEVSIDDIKPLTKEEQKANDKVYQESQQQRTIEREIRASKTREIMFKKAGLEDEAKKQALKTKEKQAKMRAFIKRTGRTRRYDREKVVER